MTGDGASDSADGIVVVGRSVGVRVMMSVADDGIAVVGVHVVGDDEYGDTVDMVGISDGVGVSSRSDDDGANDGSTVGMFDGMSVGDTDGADDGADDDGSTVGTFDGMSVGDTDGADDGADDGSTVGTFDGMSVGDTDGADDGDDDGSTVGTFDGMSVGDTDGADDGATVDMVGDDDGMLSSSSIEGESLNDVGWLLNMFEGA